MAETKKKKKVDTTTTTLSATQKQLETIEKGVETAGAGVGGGVTAPGAGTSTVPGVTSTDSGDIVPFTLPHSTPSVAAPAGLTTPTKAGGTQMTFSNWMEMIHKLQGDKAAITTLQNEMIDAGFYPSKSAVATGTLDSATVAAWTSLGLAAVDSTISATTILAQGQNAPQLISDMQSVQEKINSAREEAASVTTGDVSLTDPNKVKQTFATAMESMGLGTPTQAQADQFANAFINGPQGEVAAEQNEEDTVKHNELTGAGQLQGALADLQSGDVTAAQAAEGVAGPTDVATKSTPDLDAEAIASAKSIDPATYLANVSTNLYGLIQQELGGQLQQPTSPSSPTSEAAPGGIITAPLAGAP
jgi:hypothetical protein